jgi:hypothetical protein
MAKVRDYAVSIVATAASSIAVEMPTHATGDLLLFFFNKDTQNGGPGTPSGWSTVSGFSNPLNSTGSGNYLFAKRAASAAEALGSVSYTSETSICIVIAIQGCYGSTVADAISNCTTSGADDSALALDGGSGFTPTYNNSLVLSFLGTDAVSGPYCLPGWTHLFGGDAGGVNALAASYTFQRTSASLTHPGYWAQVADDTRWAMLAVRDDATGQIPAYLDRATVPTTLLSPLTMVNTPDKGTWELVTNDITSVSMTAGGSKTLTQLDPVTAADSGYNPFLAATRVVAASSTANMNASQLRRTADDNLTLGTGVIFGTWRPQVPRDYLDMGKVLAGGVGIMIADASNNYRMWCVGAQLSKTTKVSDRQNYIIEVATEDTDWAESASNPTLTAIQDYYFAGSGYFGACSAEWSGLYLLNLFVLAGGSASVPMTFDEIVGAVNNGGGHMPFIEKAGAAGTIWVPLRFGGGEACHVGASLAVFQFPRKADGTRYLDAHISTDKHGIEFYGLDRGSGDVDHFTFTNCVFTAESSYYWRFHASHATGAVLSFAGSTVVFAAVTLRSTVTLASVAFISCPSFTLNGADLSGCAFTDTKVLAASPADAAGIATCTFTKTTGTQHAIEIGGSPASFSLNGCQFSGYAAGDGTTGNEAIYVNTSAGSMTISITGGGATPSIRAAAGVTVTVSNNRTVTLTGLRNPSEVRVFGAGTTTEISGTGAENVTDGDHAFSVALGTSVDIVVLSLGYQNLRVLAYTVSADATLPIAQVLDRQYDPVA